MRLYLLAALAAVSALWAVPSAAQVVRAVQPIDGSGTIAAAGVSQIALSRNDSRTFLMCQNPIAANEPLFVTFDDTNASTTGGSIELAPGGTLFFAALAVPIASVRVTAATAGHRYVCKGGR